MQPVIAEALTTLGVNVNTTVTGEDWDETQQILDDRSFDLMLWAQHTLPAGDPGWFLNTFFHSGGGNNIANLNSETVDSHLASLSEAEDHDERVLMSEAAQKAIQDAMPVSNLVTPFCHVGLGERVADYEPWGSDYYVVHPDLFIAAPEDPNDVPAENHNDESLASSGKYHAAGRGWMVFALSNAAREMM